MNRIVNCKKLIRIYGDDEGFVHRACRFDGINSYVPIKELLRGAETKYQFQVRERGNKIIGKTKNKNSKGDIQIFKTDWCILTKSGKILVIDSLHFPDFFQVEE